jgi:hypothetical protein
MIRMYEFMVNPIAGSRVASICIPKALYSEKVIARRLCILK